MSSVRILTIVIISIILAIFVGYFLTTYIFYAITLKRGACVGKTVRKIFHKDLLGYGINYEFWEKHKIDKLEIVNDGLKLVGFYIKNEKPTNKLAIVLHGYYSSHKDMTIQAKIFLDLGFNVFLPDCRAHGESEGKLMSMGLNEKQDLKCWVDFLVNKYGNSTEIAIFGWSMGAGIANLYSENPSKNVKCIISDCSYDSAYGIFKSMLKRYKLPTQPTMFLLNQGARMYGEFFLKDVDIEKAVQNSRLPICFIHGEVDSLVPKNMTEKLFEVKLNGHKELHIFKDAEHCKSFVTDKDRYIKIISEFINAHFN